jgi:type I restriction enzyme S subunit
MSEWKEYRLGDIALSSDFVANGSFASLKENVKYLDSENYAILIRLYDFHNNWKGPFVYVDEGSFNFLKKSNVESGDLIIANVGANAGESFLAPPLKKSMTLGPNSILIKGSNCKYLFYYFNSTYGKWQLDSIITGSAQPKFNKTDLRNLKVKLPSETKQGLIVEILSSLDDKIELNNKINQELENLAQTLFKQWFIDFEFPNENGEPYKSSGGEMVDSELGEIPEGWTTEVLSEVTNLIRGISYRKPELVLKGEGIAFVNLKCFSLSGTFRQDGIKYYNGKYKNEQILSKNDILVAVTDLTQDREIIGMPILWNGNTTALPSLDTCIIRSETLELKNFLYYEFKTKRYKSRIIEHANGSTVLHLSVKGLETYVFPLPSESLLKNWSAIIQPILETINSNINEIIELSKTRDTLLPKLISGELEINENNN